MPISPGRIAQKLCSPPTKRASVREKSVVRASQEKKQQKSRQALASRAESLPFMHRVHPKHPGRLCSEGGTHTHTHLRVAQLPVAACRNGLYYFIPRLALFLSIGYIPSARYREKSTNQVQFACVLPRSARAFHMHRLASITVVNRSVPFVSWSGVQLETQCHCFRRLPAVEKWTAPSIEKVSAFFFCFSFPIPSADARLHRIHS